MVWAERWGTEESGMNLSVILPVLEINEYHERLTDIAISTLRKNATEDFELVIVESLRSSDREFRHKASADKHVGLRHSPKSCYSYDFNCGLDAASNSIAVQTANDLLPDYGWDLALKEPFEKFPDCGASTLLCTQHKTDHICDIEEGWFGPIMAFSSKLRLDAEGFPSIFSDTDLCMRIYKAGLRMYRNRKVSVKHIAGGEQTWANVAGSNKNALFLSARQRFHDKHRDSGLMMFRALYEGWRI